MDLIRIIAVCVLSLPLVLLVKKAAPEHGFLLSLTVLMAAVAACAALAAPAVERLQRLFQETGLESRYGSILLRMVAASLVTKLGADICRDGGSQALAGAVELAGTGAGLVIMLPLLDAVAELLLGYFT